MDRLGQQDARLFLRMGLEDREMLGAIADRADDRRLAVQVDHGGGLVPGHVQHDVFHSSMIGAATRLITGDHSGGSAACLPQTGRASCRERVCQYLWIPVVAVSVKKKDQPKRCIEWWMYYY